MFTGGGGEIIVFAIEEGGVWGLFSVNLLREFNKLKLLN